VREIARLAGVSERTLYKYVARHGWQKRHRVSPRGEAAARANRGRSLEPSPGFAPAKGAGGRFIRRDEQDEPVAVGLKATDPAAAKSAAAHCGGAALLGGIAQAKAEELQRLENMTRAISTTRVAVANWRAYRKEHKRDASAPVDRVEAMLMQVVEVSLTQWEAALAQLQAGQGQRGAIGTS
jgi:hypothetical protein